jgi:hypothetical protein
VHTGAADASQRELTLLESNADAKAEGSSDVATEADASVRSRLATSSAGEQGASPRGSHSASGLGISTCHKLVLEVCAAIKSVLMPCFLQWLATEQGHRQGGGANGRIHMGHREATGKLLEAPRRCGRRSVGPSADLAAVCASTSGRCWR